MTTEMGTIRPARLTDRQALTDLSQRAHAAGDAHRRSLGVPVADGHPPRDQPLDPDPHMAAAAPTVGAPRGGERGAAGRVLPGNRGAASRRLGHHRARCGGRADGRRGALGAAPALDRGGGQKNVGRYFAACSDVRENLELFGQASLTAYAQEEILYLPAASERGARSWLRRRWLETEPPPRKETERSRENPPPNPPPIGGRLARSTIGTSCCSRPARRTPGTSSTCGRTPRRRPSRGSRATAPPTGRPVGHEAVVPRSSLNPLLHFSDVSAWLHARRPAGRAASRSTAPAARGRTTCASWSATGPTARPSWRRCCAAAGGEAARRASSLRCEHTSRAGRMAATGGRLRADRPG